MKNSHEAETPELWARTENGAPCTLSLPLPPDQTDQEPGANLTPATSDHRGGAAPSAPTARSREGAWTRTGSQCASGRSPHT